MVLGSMLEGALSNLECHVGDSLIGKLLLELLATILLLLAIILIMELPGKDYFYLFIYLKILYAYCLLLAFLTVFVDAF